MKLESSETTRRVIHDKNQHTEANRADKILILAHLQRILTEVKLCLKFQN